MKTDIPQLLLMITIAMKENKNMRTFTITLNNIKTIKDFVKLISQYEFESEIKSGKYIINAKSIMGIFTLDLSKPVELIINTENVKVINELENKLDDMGMFAHVYEERRKYEDQILAKRAWFNKSYKE